MVATRFVLRFSQSDYITTDGSISIILTLEKGNKTGICCCEWQTDKSS